jgi:splicing factor 3A subunit 2
MKNHLGQYECRLCLTLHKNEGNYLAHTQGKRHQQNLAKRALMEEAEKEAVPAPQRRVAIKKTVKIGRPGYRVTKEFDPEDSTRALLFQIEYPEIVDGEKPRHRFMSAIEQKKEATDWNYQYVLFAAEPYETICFKVPNVEVDDSKKNVQLYRHWDPDGKVYSLQIPFRNRSRSGNEGHGQS